MVYFEPSNYSYFSRSNRSHSLEFNICHEKIIVSCLFLNTIIIIALKQCETLIFTFSTAVLWVFTAVKCTMGVHLFCILIFTFHGLRTLPLPVVPKTRNTDVLSNVPWNVPPNVRAWGGTWNGMECGIHFSCCSVPFHDVLSMCHSMTSSDTTHIIQIREWSNDPKPKHFSKPPLKSQKSFVAPLPLEVTKLSCPAPSTTATPNK